jgi:hypothetical protein
MQIKPELQVKNVWKTALSVSLNHFIPLNLSAAGAGNVS